MAHVVCQSKSQRRYLRSTCPGRNTLCLRCDSLVKIYGNWCGPSWTGGRRLTAQEYDERGLDWNYTAISPLDRGCRLHDYEGRSGKMPRAADTRLIRTARTRVLSVRKQLRLEATLLNPFISRRKRAQLNARIDESIAAERVIAGISIARPFRRS